jgi:asparagine synthase (glutamine-hydrolysing)
MLESMTHRGPDQSGLWSDDEQLVTIGHRRLSILDLSDAGRQPMVHGASGAVLAFNGECYNYLELAAELQGLGHSFRSTSDTEVVLHALVEWGEAALPKLRGMFALAFWQPASRRLLLARDRLGIKPVYYRADKGFSFASELRALLVSGLVPKTLDPSALAAYIHHGFVPGPRTLVQGVSLLEPGTVMLIDEGGSVLACRSFWKLPAKTSASQDPSKGEEAQKVLRKAVQQHLASDVPLGVFLSGGVDSSVIAALAQQESRGNVATFNIRFDEAAYDESSYARQVAEILGTDHQEVRLTEAVFSSHLDEAMSSIDQPTFDAINTYFVSRAVKEAGLTVALAGTGGDELFGGYASFRDVPKAARISKAGGLLPSRVRRWLEVSAVRWTMGRAGEVPPQTRWGKLSDMLAARGDMVAAYQVAYGLFASRLQRELLLDQTAMTSWGHYPNSVAAWQADILGESPLAAVSKLEMHSFLTERLLRDTDAASMAVSLEVRVPLLDHEFVEAVLRLDDRQRFDPVGRKKWLLDVVADQLPMAMFDRPKAGFELPLERWCANSLSSRISDTLTDINLAHAIGLNAECVGRIWRAFRKGAPGLYWSRVWSLYTLMSWCREHGVFLKSAGPGG